MKQLLFPTDFSKAAENAFVYALKIANHFGASITILHVYNLLEALDVYGHDHVDDLYEQLRAQKLAQFEASLSPLKEIVKEAQMEHIELNPVIQEGLAVDKILEVAAKELFGLIVLGTTGASGLKEVFLGSIAGEMLERAPCMTLAVPQNAVFDQAIDQIAMATSYQEDEVQALKDLMIWTETLNASVQVVNVDLAHTEFYLKRMDQFKAKIAPNPRLSFQVIEGTDFVTAMTAYLKEQDTDLLAMVTHKRNFIQELFRYSRAKMMSYHTSIPILSLPAKG